jgi:hypothetical protein
MQHQTCRLRPADLPLAALAGSQIICGITGYHRKGVGRQLVAALRDGANADNEDLQALDFYRAIEGTASPVTIFTLEQP